MWCHVDLYISANISEDPAGSIIITDDESGRFLLKYQYAPTSLQSIIYYNIVTFKVTAMENLNYAYSFIFYFCTAINSLDNTVQNGRIISE